MRYLKIPWVHLKAPWVHLKVPWVHLKAPWVVWGMVDPQTNLSYRYLSYQWHQQNNLEVLGTSHWATEPHVSCRGRGSARRRQRLRFVAETWLRYRSLTATPASHDLLFFLPSTPRHALDMHAMIQIVTREAVAWAAGRGQEEAGQLPGEAREVRWYSVWARSSQDVGNWPTPQRTEGNNCLEMK